MKYKISLVLMASTLAATGSMAADYLTSQRDMRTSTAEVIARAALAECQKKGYTVAVAVTDRSGTPLAILRDDMAGAHTPSIAIGKAWTAANFRMSTTEVVAVSEPGQPAAAIRNLPNVVALGGGLPIQTKGTTIGAIGVSGAPGGHLDEACAQTAVKSIQSALDLP